MTAPVLNNHREDGLSVAALIEHHRENAATLEHECRADGDWDVYRSVAAKSTATADALEALTAKIAGLEGALEPFAALGIELGEGFTDDQLFSVDRLTGHEVTFGQVRKARAALSPKDGLAE